MPHNTLKPENTDLPTMAKLGEDVILLILEAVNDSHADSMASVKLACRQLNRLAAYVSSSFLKLVLCSDCGFKAENTLKYIEKHALLTAVRRIEISTSEGLRPDCYRASRTPERLSQRPGAEKRAKQNKSNQPAVESADQQENALRHLNRLLPHMTGLKDLSWPNNKLSQATLDALPQQVRLHARITGTESRKAPKSPRGLLMNNKNLYSLEVRSGYTNASIRHELMEPVKELILSTPHLRSLTLDIGMPKGGCVIIMPPREYCGMGFVDGEKPPALEHLRIDGYPFGRKYEEPRLSGPLPLQYQAAPPGFDYPGEGREEDYWAETFDWSRLKTLHVRDPDLALALMPKLTAIEEVSISAHWKPEPVRKFYFKVPSTLTKVNIPNLHCAPIEALIRHGSTLRELEIHQQETGGEGWRQDAQLIASILPKLRDQCPLIDTLSLDIPRSNDWPYSTLDVLASFPRLRSLTIWFDLGAKNNVTEPRVTFSAVKELFIYLHTRSPKIREFRVYSGCHRPHGFGYPGPDAFWPQYNSMEFSCKLSERDDEARKGVFECECPSLGEKENQSLRRYGGRGKESKTPDLMFNKQTDKRVTPRYLSGRTDEAVEVARNGPKTVTEWAAQRRYP